MSQMYNFGILNIDLYHVSGLFCKNETKEMIVLSDELTFLHFPFLISQMSAEHILIKYLFIIC